MADYQDPLVVDPSNGNVRGDPKPMPNRGTGSGMVGMGAPFGADIGMNATNRMGSAHLEGDPMDLCYPKGDADLRFSSSGHSSTDYGTSITGATGSDAPEDDEPINPKM